MSRSSRSPRSASAHSRKALKSDDRRAKGYKLRVRRAHLVGMGGAGMRALAELMQDFGCRITGSDASLSDDVRWQMHARGLRVWAGHAAAQLPAEADVLIYSPAVPSTNPERQAAGQLGMPQLSLPEALGWLMQSRDGISITGTHGKTTTTALLGHIIEEAGGSPSVICGGEVCSRGANGWAGRGQALVVESCEYRRHFLSLAPRHAILLNIEPDHFDCFSSLDDAVAAYAAFLGRLPSEGILVANRDSVSTLRAVRRAGRQAVTFGSRGRSPARSLPGPTVDWAYHRLRRTTSGWSFLVERNGEHIGRFLLPSFVRHNVKNALATIALGHHLGIPRHRLQLGVRTFTGVSRRFEQLELPNGAVLIDDYAHHPTAIAGVLATARERHSSGRLVCAFQPHQVSRTRALLREFARSLRWADEVLIPPVFTARERPGKPAEQTSRELVCELRRQGTRARFVQSLDGIRRTIETAIGLGDLAVTLGAGDIDSIATDLQRRLRRPQAS